MHKNYKSYLFMKKHAKVTSFAIIFYFLFLYFIKSQQETVFVQEDRFQWDLILLHGIALVIFKNHVFLHCEF